MSNSQEFQNRRRDGGIERLSEKEHRELPGLNGHEFEQTLEDSEGQGRLACCSPRGHTESDTTEQLN